MCESTPAGVSIEADCGADSELQRVAHAKWIVFAALAFAAVACFVRSGVVIDDAMISFRYARHVAQGHGLRWNTDEPPTEGYTNFLWVVLLAPIERMGWDAYVCARILGAVCFLAAITLAYLVACRAMRDQRAGLLAAWLVASNANLAYVSVLGMETSLFALAVLATIAATIWPGTPRPWMAAVAALVATLVRPEGAAVGVLAAFMMLAYGNTRRGRIALVWLGCFLVPLIAYASFRIWYFGHPLPNSFYIKSRGLALSTAGCQYVTAFLRGPYLVFFVLLLGGIAVTGLSMHAATVLTLTLFFLAYFLSVEPMMGGYYRFLIWLLPPVVVYDACALVHTAQVFPSVRQRSTRIARWALAAVLCLASSGGIETLAKAAVCIRTRGAYRSQYPRHHLSGVELRLGKLLSRIKSEGATLACGDAGAMPYYSGWRHVDLVGLNNPVICFGQDRPVAEIATSVLAQNPDLIIVPFQTSTVSIDNLSDATHGPFPKLRRELMSSTPFQAHYEHMGTFAAHTYHLGCFADRRSPVFDQLRRLIGSACDYRP